MFTSFFPYLSIYLSIYLSNLTVYLNIDLFIYLFIYLFIADEKPVPLHQLNKLSFRATLQPLSATNQHTILHLKPGIRLKTFI